MNIVNTTKTRLETLKELVKSLLDTLSTGEAIKVMERIKRYDQASEYNPALLERYLQKILSEYGVVI